MSVNPTRLNHYVPQAYLKNWSTDERTIFVYRTLVSHKKVPVWRRPSIKGIAYVPDLYTETVDGREVDNFERWITDEYEVPAQITFLKVQQGQKLNRDDWERLALFFAAQDLRTPLNYIESVLRWEKNLQGITEQVVTNAVERIREAKRKGVPLEVSNRREEPPFAKHFKVSIEKSTDPAQDGAGVVKTEATLGRKLWLDSMRHLLPKRASILLAHKWSILRPRGGAEWFTSDHPALKLNYRNSSNYDFNGGWNSTNTELMLPLSPKHLLYTKIGTQGQEYISLSWDKTYLIQRMLAERAHRMIFAKEPIERVPQIRARVVNSVLFEEECTALKRWHDQQN